jgi:hypothetical protein
VGEAPDKWPQYEVRWWGDQAFTVAKQAFPTALKHLEYRWPEKLIPVILGLRSFCKKVPESSFGAVEQTSETTFQESVGGLVEAHILGQYFDPDLDYQAVPDLRGWTEEGYRLAVSAGRVSSVEQGFRQVCQLIEVSEETLTEEVISYVRRRYGLEADE